MRFCSEYVIASFEVQTQFFHNYFPAQFNWKYLIQHLTSIVSYLHDGETIFWSKESPTAVSLALAHKPEVTMVPCRHVNLEKIRKPAFCDFYVYVV